MDNVRRVFPSPERAEPAKASAADRVINVCVRGTNDWLFRDLREAFSRTQAPGIRVIASDEPHAGADGWVFIRTAEAVASPDLARTVVCLHDLYSANGMYSPTGERGAVHSAAGLVLCHPSQRMILAQAGVSLAGKLILERPLGALQAFTVRKTRPERFTIGWVGRNCWPKRPGFLMETVARFRVTCPEVRVVLIGKGLAPLKARFSQANTDCELHDRNATPISKYPALYQGLDCLLITSSTEAGPLPLFEALATGVPVVATPVGWAPHFAALEPSFVRLGNDPQQLAAGLVMMWCGAPELFKARSQIAALTDVPRLDSWFVETLQLSAAVLDRHAVSRPPL